jgi:hypothetical protein
VCLLAAYVLDPLDGHTQGLEICRRSLAQKRACSPILWRSMPREDILNSASYHRLDVSPTHQGEDAGKKLGRTHP